MHFTDVPHGLLTVALRREFLLRLTDEETGSDCSTPKLQSLDLLICHGSVPRAGSCGDSRLARAGSRSVEPFQGIYSVKEETNRELRACDGGGVDQRAEMKAKFV